MSERNSFTPMDRKLRTRVLRIAHRGASAYAPENSLLAFHKAADMGADMVEIDIQLTADDVPVVAHDARLNRVYGIDTAIDELTAIELANLPLNGLDPVPTFERVAYLCADLKLGLYLDIKNLNMRSGATLLDILWRTGLMPYTIFGSFSPDFLAELKHAEAGLKTSILFSSIHVQPVALAQSVRADYVHPCWERAAPEPHKLLTPEWIKAVRAENLGIICWHEERPSEISALSSLGVDGICTDTPDVLTALTP